MDAVLNNFYKAIGNAVKGIGEESMGQVNLLVLPKQPPKEGDENALKEKLFKLRKIIPHGMVEDFEAMDEDGLHSRIVQSGVNIHETEKAEDADEDLKSLKEKVKEAKGPYTDAKKVQKAIASYCLCLLEQSGKI